MSKPKSFMNCYAYFRVYQEAIKWLENRGVPLKKETDEILFNWLRYLGNKTRDIFVSLPWAQRRCSRCLPISQRLLFDLITSMPKPGQKAAAKPENPIKRVLRRVLPKGVKMYLKRLMRRIPHRVKEKVKRLIRW